MDEFRFLSGDNVVMAFGGCGGVPIAEEAVFDVVRVPAAERDKIGIAQRINHRLDVMRSVVVVVIELDDDVALAMLDEQVALQAQPKVLGLVDVVRLKT